jgi:hypothetical protein
MTTPPPQDPWHQRYWAYTNRPFRGCGCLGFLLLGILLSVVISALLPNGTLVCLPFVF